MLFTQINLRKFCPPLLKTCESERHWGSLCATKREGQRNWGGRAGKLPWSCPGAAAAQIKSAVLQAWAGLRCHGVPPGPTLAHCPLPLCWERAAEPCAAGTARRAAHCLR